MFQASERRIDVPCISWTIVALFLSTLSVGADQAPALPSGSGLAAKYPGDVGIDKDPAVVFVENFEASTREQVTQEWESVSHGEIMSLSPDVPADSGGKKSLLMNHVGGEGEGAHLYQRLSKGYDKLHVRFYVKFDPDCAPVHHFFHVGGYNPPTPYPQGGAGERPRGNERMSVGIEPFGDNWVWDYYAYWMEMRGSPPRGQTWGNSFIHDRKQVVRRGEWMCLETMIKLNDVGESNGELAMWIDGKLVSHLGKGFPKGKWTYDKFVPGDGGDGVRWSEKNGGPEYFTVPEGGEPFEGFRWRSDDKLQLNFIWLLFYMTDIPRGHESKVQFDDVVLAKEYIGPIARPGGDTEKKVRVGAAQPKSRLIDYRVTSPAEVLARVDQSLAELAVIVKKAADAGCNVIALPEDTLGLGLWEAGNESALNEVLPAAIEKMLDKLGRAAAKHRIYVVCCNDTLDAEGSLRNTAFLIGPDGKQLGRYDKVNMPIHELHKKRGNEFPVFKTTALGDVGMLICYDMVFPEAARCLALGGADIIFHPTLGGAAIGDEELSRAVFRTRAVENFVYIVVSQRGGGSMILSPQGEVLAEGAEPDGIVIADIDLNGNRDGGDAFNHQRDMRARIFRERSPTAFGILTDPHPPVLEKVPETVSIADASRIANAALTVGEGEFKQADALLRSGHADEAVRAFEALRTKYPHTWIDRVAGERLLELAKVKDNSSP